MRLEARFCSLELTHLRLQRRLGQLATAARRLAAAAAAAAGSLLPEVPFAALKQRIRARARKED